MTADDFIQYNIQWSTKWFNEYENGDSHMLWSPQQQIADQLSMFGRFWTDKHQKREYLLGECCFFQFKDFMSRHIIGVPGACGGLTPY